MIRTEEAGRVKEPCASRHERLLVWMSRTGRACSRGLEKLDGRCARHQAETRGQGDGELEAIVRMKLQFGGQIAQGDAEEVPAEKASATAVQPEAATGLSCPSPI